MLTTITTEKQISDIHNFHRLPDEVKETIRKAKRIDSRGFQELVGYIDRQAIWSAGGYWTDGVCEADQVFHIESLGTANELVYKENK